MLCFRGLLGQDSAVPMSPMGGNSWPLTISLQTLDSLQKDTSVVCISNFIGYTGNALERPSHTGHMISKFLLRIPRLPKKLEGTFRLIAVSTEMSSLIFCDCCFYSRTGQNHKTIVKAFEIIAGGEGYVIFIVIPFHLS